MGAAGRSSDNAGNFGFGFLGAVKDVLTGSARTSKKHESRLSKQSKQSSASVEGVEKKQDGDAIM